MTDLLVCRAPGDELAEFGPLLLSRPPGTIDVIAVTAHPLRPDHVAGESVLRASCAAAGARKARLLPFAHLPEDRIDAGEIASALGDLGGYERIFTHSAQDPRPLCARVAAAVGRSAPVVWTTAGGGCVDHMVQTTEQQFVRGLALLADHYGDLLAEGMIAARDLRNIALLQRHAGRNLYRYGRGYLDWHAGDFDFAQPWELEASAYEARRHAAEMAMVASLPWQTLVEVGACEGAFTAKLCDAYPERHIVAFEPDPFFFRTLQRRIGDRAELHQGDAEAAGAIPCDLLFMSSAIYYLWRMPYSMLRSARQVVVSHAQRFHRGQFDHVLQAQGFEPVRTTQVPACIEPMEGILEVKYGGAVGRAARGMPARDRLLAQRLHPRGAPG